MQFGVLNFWEEWHIIGSHIWRGADEQMNPMLWAVIFALAAVAIVVFLTLLVALCVTWAGSRYGEKLQRNYQNKILELLPGKDCGQCGCATCSGYARGVMFGVEAETACPYVSEETPQEMLELVKELHKLLEDPKPIKQRKRFRLMNLFIKQDPSSPTDGNT